MLAGAQDRVSAIDAADRRTTAAGLALVARRGRIVEIKAARALQEMPPVEAMLRNCCEAPARMALASNG
jgi:uncharacterized lipoprotein YajG